MSDVSRTLTLTILVYLMPGCRNETLDTASRVVFIDPGEETGDLLRVRSMAMLFNIGKLVWSSYLLKSISQMEGN